MRPLLPIFALALLSQLSIAGDPASAPEETRRRFELIDPAALGFGASGFTVDAGVQGQLGYDDAGGGLETFELRTIAPLGKIDRGDWIFGATVNHAWTHADFGRFGGLQIKDLQTLKATVLAAWLPPNSRWWALGFVSPGVATDFENLGSDGFAATALALLGYRWNSRLDVAVGAFASYGLGEATVIPAAGFIWRPNDRWIVQATPPIVAIGFKPVDGWLLSAVGYPAGGEWEVGRDRDAVRQIDLTLWRAALSVERKLTEHWRVGVRGGVSFGGELELRDGESRVVAEQDLAVAPFGAVSVRWAF